MARRRAKRQPAGQSDAPPPALPLARHVVVDTALRQGAGHLLAQWLQFCEFARECLAEQYYVKWGYEDAAGYFHERVGISYRSVRRYLSVAEGIERLPEADRVPARAALEQVGLHRSAILAPLLGREGVDWRATVEQAKERSIQALQEQVSHEVGARPRGAAPPEDRFLTWLLARMPDDESRDEVRLVFEMGMEIGETKNTLAVFLYLIRNTKVEWAHALGRKRAMRERG